MPTPDLTPARTALKDADQQVTHMGQQWPDLWANLDRFRKHQPMAWPNWCLFRMGALNAWRHTRSVYLVEPYLQRRLIDQVPDLHGRQLQVQMKIAVR